jgi:hypothetical protein
MDTDFAVRHQAHGCRQRGDYDLGGGEAVSPPGLAAPLI